MCIDFIFIFNYLDHVLVVEVDHDLDVVRILEPEIKNNILIKFYRSGSDRRRRSPGYAYD